jgi:hypothetical protein
MIPYCKKTFQKIVSKLLIILADTSTWVCRKIWWAERQRCRFSSMYFRQRPFCNGSSEWVSERLLFNAKWAIFQLQYISWQEHVTFHEMMMSTLYWYNMLSLNFIMLAHWNDSPLVDMSPPLGHFSSMYFRQRPFCNGSMGKSTSSWRKGI